MSRAAFGRRLHSSVRLLQSLRHCSIRLLSSRPTGCGWKSSRKVAEKRAQANPIGVAQVQEVQKVVALGNVALPGSLIDLDGNLAQVVHEPDRDPPRDGSSLKEMLPLDVVLELVSVHQIAA